MDTLQRYPQSVQKAISPHHPFIEYVEQRFREVQCFDLLLREKLEYAKVLSKRPTAIEQSTSETEALAIFCDSFDYEDVPAIKKRRVESDPEHLADSPLHELDMDDSMEVVESLADLSVAGERLDESLYLAVFNGGNAQSKPGNSARSAPNRSDRQPPAKKTSRHTEPLVIRNSSAFTEYRPHVVAESVRRKHVSKAKRSGQRLKNLHTQVAARRIPDCKELTEYEVRILNLYRKYERLLVEDNNFLFEELQRVYEGHDAAARAEINNNFSDAEEADFELGIGG